MSEDSDSRELIEEARTALGQVKQALLNPTPSTVEGCTQPLAEAAKCLRLLKTQRNAGGFRPANAGPESSLTLRDTANELLKDLEEVQKLLQQAGAFYLGWSRILLSATGTYTSSGEIRPPVEQGTLVING